MGIYQGTCAVELCSEITFFIAQSILSISHILDHLFNPFQTGVAFNIQTGHLNWRENHMTDFYMKCITGLICINKNNFFLGGHPLSTYAKFSEKLTLLTPWYAHVRVRINGLETLVFQKILRTYLKDDHLLGSLKYLERIHRKILRLHTPVRFNLLVTKK